MPPMFQIAIAENGTRWDWHISDGNSVIQSGQMATRVQARFEAHSVMLRLLAKGAAATG